MQMLLRMAPHQVSDTSACWINCNRRHYTVTGNLQIEEEKMGKSCRNLRLRVLMIHFPCVMFYQTSM